MAGQQGSHVPGVTEQASLISAASTGTASLSLARDVAHCHRRKHVAFVYARVRDGIQLELDLRFIWTNS